VADPTELHENIKGQLTSEAVVELWEIDWSILVGDPLGTELNIRRFINDSKAGAVGVFLDGVPYDPLPIRGRNFEIRNAGAPRHPQIEIANGDGLVSSVIASLGGDIVGAQITRRRIFRRHLDDGAAPDPLAEWPPQVWVIERLLGEDRWRVEFELAARLDAETDLPTRRLSHDHCSWVYKSNECGWNPGGGPYFDANGDPTSQPSDNCGLRPDDCFIRFNARNEALRFGGQTGIIRKIGNVTS
jgi:lambda family phage minor tail protein L